MYAIRSYYVSSETDYLYDLYPQMRNCTYPISWNADFTEWNCQTPINFAAFGEVANDADPFIIELSDEYAPNDVVDLIFTIEDGEYHDQGGVFFVQQPSYRDHVITSYSIHYTKLYDTPRPRS